MQTYKCYKWLIIFCVFLSVIIIAISGCYINKNERNNTSMELTKKQLLLIAKTAFKENLNELHLEVDKGKVVFDRENKVWNKYYAERYPHLSNYDYQVIQFFPQGTKLTMGGGPFWVCIDKKTGQILQFDIGL